MGTPKSSISVGFPFLNHPFWGTPILGNLHTGNPMFPLLESPPSDDHAAGRTMASMRRSSAAWP